MIMPESLKNKYNPGTKAERTGEACTCEEGLHGIGG